jgi:uncharacterized HAD superfamily protein
MEYDLKQVEFRDANNRLVKKGDLYDTFLKYEPHGLYAALPPMSEVKHALHLIRKLGYHIILITARKPEYEEQTIFNLLNNDLEYDKLFFSTDKAELIRKLYKEYEIVCFADDKASTVIDVFDNTKVKRVFLVNQQHNKSIQVDDQIKRINNIFEIVRYLPDIS